MFCYVKLRYVMSCHVMSYPVILCHVKRCCTLLFYNMLCYVMLCYGALLPLSMFFLLSNLVREGIRKSKFVPPRLNCASYAGWVRTLVFSDVAEITD